MSKSPAFLALACFAVALAPGASAAEASSTVLLHDLFEDGSYVGCHVTSPSFASFRLTVNQGDRVVLTVQAPENNTNVHSLSVEGVDGRTGPLKAGESETFELVAEESGSHAVLCDETSSSLQGILLVRAASTNGGGTNESPAPGALLALAAGAVAVGLARRRA